MFSLPVIGGIHRPKRLLWVPTCLKFATITELKQPLQLLTTFCGMQRTAPSCLDEMNLPTSAESPIFIGRPKRERSRGALLAKVTWTDNHKLELERKVK